MLSTIVLQNVCIFGFFFGHQRPARNIVGDGQSLEALVNSFVSADCPASHSPLKSLFTSNKNKNSCCFYYIYFFKLSIYSLSYLGTTKELFVLKFNGWIDCCKLKQTSIMSILQN